MKTASRTSPALLLMLASLYGCEAVHPTAPALPSVQRNAPPPLPPPPYLPESPTIDAYKAAVAQHVVAHNPAHTFTGRLPPMLPAIVVLNITVDRDGRVTEVVVQRSRDPDASRVALDSMARSGTLPAPHRMLLARVTSLTFSETFLFDDAYRFQLRTLAGPQ